MVKEYNYINIREVLSRVLRHPMLQDITLEQAIQYTLDFIGIFGLPKMYQDKETELHIEDFRCELPCDLVSINQVKNNKTGLCLRHMSDTFNPTEGSNDEYDATFKTQGQVLFTSFKTGDITVSYKAIPVDDDGYPMLIDNPVFLKTLEAYIKREAFTVLFDMSKIPVAVLTNVQQQYAWLARQLQSEFTIPSVSEMENLKNNWCSLIQRTNEFSKGFSNYGNVRQIKVH